MRRSVQMVGTLVDQQKGQDARNRGRSSAHIHLYRLALAHSPLGGGGISNSMLMSNTLKTPIIKKSYNALPGISQFSKISYKYREIESNTS